MRASSGVSLSPCRGAMPNEQRATGHSTLGFPVRLLDASAWRYHTTYHSHDHPSDQPRCPSGARADADARRAVAPVKELIRDARKRSGDDDDRASSRRLVGLRARLTRFGRDWAVVVALATVALIGVGKVGEDVFAHETTSFDGAVQSWALAHQHPVLTSAFVIITTIGGVASMCLIALAGGLFLAVRGHRRVAAGTLIAPAAAVILFSLVKRVYARARPPGLGGIVPGSYAFPSGHATGSTAVSCTLAYVFWREGYISRPVALTIAILPPLLTGMSRVYLNVHWATDVIGGWSAGLLIAVLFAALYDRYRRRLWRC